MPVEDNLEIGETQSPQVKRNKMTPEANGDIIAATTTTTTMPHPSTKSVPRDEYPTTLRIKKLSEHGRAPERGSTEAAGYDLFSASDLVIPPGDKAVVPTDISLAIPSGYYGRVAPRSGLAVKHFIDVGAGVIDADYRGPLGVVLFNFGQTEFKVKQGDRIAQLILTKIITPTVEITEDLDDTARGAGGFGSTGQR